MSDTAIRVENLGKKYVLRHSQSSRRYKTFRDLLTDKWKTFFASRATDSVPGLRGGKEEFWALKDVSFEVKQGEAVGIIGRNGAGKSTLLKLLSRITEPTAGRIELQGRVASLLEVGTGFHPELTGRENVYLNGSILGMARAEIRAKFDEIVSFAEVERFLDTPVKRYSSGMYMRLAFAVAAHLDPEILIVDEVLAVGDAAFQKRCLNRMGQVVKGGVTVIFVSHNMAAISNLTTEALFLSSGSLQFKGLTLNAIKAYTSSGEDSHLSYANAKKNDPPEPRIVSVTIKTSLPDNIQICNEPFEAEITIETPNAVIGACIAIQIFDPEQVNYAHFWIHDAAEPICRVGGKHLLRCIVPNLRLYMGHYRLRVFFSEPPGGRLFETLDGICPFEVIMSDNSRIFQWWPKECTYLEEFTWETHSVKS